MLNKHSANRQAGFLLLEGLIAIAIFSFGLLALVALQANAVNAIGEAKYRMDAAMFADKLVGRMWVNDKTTLQNDFQSSPAGAKYLQWRTEIDNSNTLPGSATNPPEVLVTGAGEVTITVNWLYPGAEVPHSYVTITQIQ